MSPVELGLQDHLAKMVPREIWDHLEHLVNLELVDLLVIRGNQDQKEAL